MLQVSVDEATAMIDATPGFELFLPEDEAFQNMELSKDMDEAIHKAETATSGK